MSEEMALMQLDCNMEVVAAAKSSTWLDVFCAVFLKDHEFAVLGLKVPQEVQLGGNTQQGVLRNKEARGGLKEFPKPEIPEVSMT
eukprot:3774506-Amphidinium_carterae.1